MYYNPKPNVRGCTNEPCEPAVGGPSLVFIVLFPPPVTRGLLVVTLTGALEGGFVGKRKSASCKRVDNTSDTSGNS